jgi:hypothetical protein
MTDGHLVSHGHDIGSEEDRELIDDLILQNKTMDALIKGLTGDIDIFKQDQETWTPTDIVRLTMQLNIMKDKKARNLASINEIIKKHKGTL